MPDLDPTALLEMTVDVVAAYVTRNHIQVGDMPNLIASVHRSLAGMGSTPKATEEVEKPVPPISIKKSLMDDYLVSLEDGKRYKSLKRHLSRHGLSPSEYRAKWGLPTDYPMVAPAYARKRSELAKSIGLGNLRKSG
jgi:predicted transcriptional regulator